MRKIKSLMRKIRASVGRRVTTVDTDIAVYGASAFGTIAGFVIESFDRGEGTGIIISLGSIFVAGIRMILKKLAKGAQSEGLFAMGDDLTPFAQGLWDEEVKRARTHLRAIEEGELVVRNTDRLGRCLQLMTQRASGQMYAVDFVELGTWFTSQAWIDYLKIQMQACRDETIHLTRIRVVSKEELNDRAQLLLLSTFVKEHEDAGATLLLCPEGALEGLENVWTFRSDGCLLAHIDGFPACIIGPNVYLKDSTVVQTCRVDFMTLRRYIVDEGLDEITRRNLNRALNEDFDDDTPEND